MDPVKTERIKVGELAAYAFKQTLRLTQATSLEIFLKLIKQKDLYIFGMISSTGEPCQTVADQKSKWYKTYLFLLLILTEIFHYALNFTFSLIKIFTVS